MNVTSSNSTTPVLPAVELWYWSLRVVISLLTLLGNTVVILLIVRCPRLRVTPNVYICTLALADIFVGAIVTPSEFACTYIYFNACAMPALRLTYDILIHLSVTNLCALTFDRYTAIVHPLQYQAHQIRKGCFRRVAFILFIAWFSAAAIPVTGYLSRGHHHVESIFRAIDMAFFQIIPPFLLLAAYARMVYIARKHERKIKLQEFQLNFNYSVESLTQPRRSRGVESRERASVRMIGAVIVAFLICYVLAMFRSLYGRIMQKSIPKEITYLSRLLLLSNSAINFVVYAFLKKDFRSELKRVCSYTLDRIESMLRRLFCLKTTIREL